MRFGPVFLRQQPLQLAFYLEGRICVLRQANPVSHAKHVGVNRQGVYLKGNRSHDLGGFSPHTGQFDQFLQGIGNIAAKIGHHHPGEPYQVF